jgi:antitoxin VapB
MPFHVRDAETNTLVRRLAAETGTGITDTIKLAVSNELKRREANVPLAERIRPIQDFIMSHKKIVTTETDKEFWDDMCGDPDVH